MERKEESSVAGEVVPAREPTSDIAPDESVGQPPAIDSPALATMKAKKGTDVALDAEPSDRPSEEYQPEPASTRDAPPQEDLLLVAQLTSSARVAAFSIPRLEQRMMDDAIDLYRSLGPQDPIESLLGRLMIGVTNSSMDCLGRAARCNQSLPARDLNLRYGIKGTAVVADLVKVWESHRGQGRQNVTVGTVSVEAGGQAVVGNVEIGEQRKQPMSPIPRASITESDE